MDGLADPKPVAAAVPAIPTLGELFRGFLGLGLMGFGGVLPLAHHMLVEDRRWLSATEFADLLGLCQFLPGGNIINLTVAVGLRFRGIPGAVAALAGLVAAPASIVIALGAVYGRFRDDPSVRNAFAGLAAAAAGLLIAMALRIAAPLRGRPAGMALAALCFAAVAVLRLPLLPTMLVMAPLSVLVTWRAER